MGEILFIKVKEKGSKTGYVYKNQVNLLDLNLLSIILRDLEVNFNAPIEKVCKKYLSDYSRTFPI